MTPGEDASKRSAQRGEVAVVYRSFAMKVADDPYGAESAPSAEMVAVTLGIPHLRLDLLRAIARRNSATVSQLASDVGCTRNGLRPHMTSLEALGAITTDVVRLPGRFRPTRLVSLNSRRLEEIAWSVFEAITTEIGLTEAADA